MAFSAYPAKGGIPSGLTAGRPGSPVEGDTYYNGTLGLLEIYTPNGWQPCSAPAGIPTITSVTATSTADAYSSTGGKLSVAFTPAASGGLATSFTVYTSTGGFSTTGASSPLVITGLNPDTAYSVYVSASNGFGSGGNSGNFAAVYPSTLPQAPVITSVTANASNFSIAFTSNAGGNTVTNYQFSLDDGATFTAFSPAQTTSPLTVSSLGGYTFRIKSVTSGGTSGQSNAIASASTISSLEYLVVAGGGGGGGNGGSNYARAGGGGGGYGTGTITSTLVAGTAYTVTVGAGGPGGDAAKGANSVFNTITRTGGGGGGYQTAASGSGGAGGSGGGKPGQGAYSPGTGNQGGYSPVEGYDGGGGTDAENTYSGGGGGAGGVGVTGAASGNGGGYGGTGAANSITGTSTYYAGGGGGGSGYTGGPGNYGNSAGGNGGGGGGRLGYVDGGNGTANLGGGGGGTRGGGSSVSGNGGSGVVILKYPSGFAPTFSGGLTASTVTSGSNKISTVTAGTGTVTF